MIKTLLVAICVFFALTSAQNYACPGRQCVATNGNCYPSTSNSGVSLQCTKGQYCLYNSDSTAATCANNVAIGALCNFTGGGDFACTGDFSYCDNEGTGASNTCKNGVINVASGGACGSNRYCGNGLYCKLGADYTGTCAAWNAKDSTCSQGNACQPNQVCSIGKCINAFSVAKDGACDGDLNCQAGLYCSAGKCASSVTGSGAYCDASATCATGSICSCPARSGNYGVGNQTCNTPVTYTSSAVTAITNMLNCLQSAQCSVDSTFAAPGYYCNACKSQMCQGMGSYNRANGVDNFCGKTDSFATLQAYYCNSATTAVASFAAIAVAVFALFM